MNLRIATSVVFVYPISINYYRYYGLLTRWDWLVVSNNQIYTKHNYCTQTIPADGNIHFHPTAIQSDICSSLCCVRCARFLKSISRTLRTNTH